MADKENNSFEPTETRPTYEQIKQCEVAFIAKPQVYDVLEELKQNAFKSFMDVMNYWDGDRVATRGFEIIKEIVNEEVPSTGRLLIRLAILQALSDLENAMTQREILAYLKVNVRQMLSHAKALAIHGGIKGVLRDIASMSGVAIPGATDPSPHPNPPIDCIAITDTTAGFTSSQYHFSREDQAVLNDVEEGLANPGPTEREAVIKARINQSVFRSRLLQRGNCCAVSGLENNKLLIASHIKPWSVCEPSERLDPNNGLLLAAHLDRLFDSGLITFDEDGAIAVSKELCDQDKQILGLDGGLRLRYPMSKLMEQYMQYHRAEVFKE